MITIRAEQMDAMGRAVARRFEDGLLAHVRRAWPAEYAALGEAETRAWIREGVARAARYGITLDYDVARYVNTMMCLGRRFDQDPARAWAREILGNEAMGSREKTDMLCQRAGMEPEAARPAPDDRAEEGAR